MIEQIASAERVQMEAGDLATYTDFACELATLARAEILPYFRAPVAVDNKVNSDGKSGFDPVTIADRAAERVMRDKIRESYAGHGILGEEHGLHIGETGLTWVLDPIDGTRAFITGLPLWGVLIALFDGVEPVLGVMDQPYLNERYTGNGEQAWFVKSPANHGVRQTDLEEESSSRTRLNTRTCTQVKDAIMMTTSPDMFQSKAEQQAFYRLAESVRMHRYGGDCYAYCMLASGFVDLVVEADLEPYDIQALMPIVQGAGGVITNWQGESARAGGQVIAAATPELHREALAMLATAV
jgi:myo-inositol-1(or 4)-monophosphatase